ncbi:ferritin-like domain-containing protein [uncultured Helicobacter sp.]|uniref:ferritin-like domain-containing protein n=1 Tax=uncultured Helicobacter sp. TaxID=175537 RepID=UPI003751ADBC
MQHKHSLIMGDIPLGKLFFMRLENTFLLIESNDCLEILSDYDNLAPELISYCRFKGEEFLHTEALPMGFAYYLKKRSPKHFVALQGDSIDSLAPSEMGLSARGSKPQVGSPNYYFGISSKEAIWSENVSRIYEDSKNAQWNATRDIDWTQITTLSPSLESSIAQIMTYLVENELSALYIPSKFLPQISPYFHEVPLLLSSIIGDEARHIEVFIKRAKATGLGLQYSTLATQQSLYTLFKERDYFASSFLLHIMGEGTFVDLLGFLEDYAPDEPTKKLLSLARRDEKRHVAYGMNNVKNALARNPGKIAFLKDIVFKRKHYLDEFSSESSLLLESLAIYAGGGGEVAQIKRGFEAVEHLKDTMEHNRAKRLRECGIEEGLAWDLSKAHTPNFM